MKSEKACQIKNIQKRRNYKGKEHKQKNLIFSRELIHKYLKENNLRNGKTRNDVIKKNNPRPGKGCG